MKTKLIHRGVLPSIEEGINLLEKIDESAFEEALNIIAKEESLNRIFISDTYLHVAQKFNIRLSDLVDALSCALNILSAEEEGDNINDVLDDLIELNILEPEKQEVTRKRLELAKNLISKNIKVMVGRRSALASSFPVLDFIRTRCALTSSFGRGFNAGIDTPESYEPNVALNVPVLIINFQIDKFGDDITEHFAVSEKQLDQIINHLLLAKKELITFKETLNIKEE